MISESFLVSNKFVSEGMSSPTENRLNQKLEPLQTNRREKQES